MGDPGRHVQWEEPRQAHWEEPEAAPEPKEPQAPKDEFPLPANALVEELLSKPRAELSEEMIGRVLVELPTVLERLDPFEMLAQRNLQLIRLLQDEVRQLRLLANPAGRAELIENAERLATLDHDPAEPHGDIAEGMRGAQLALAQMQINEQARRVEALERAHGRLFVEKEDAISRAQRAEQAAARIAAAAPVAPATGGFHLGQPPPVAALPTPDEGADEFDGDGLGALPQMQQRAAQPRGSRAVSRPPLPELVQEFATFQAQKPHLKELTDDDIALWSHISGNNPPIPESKEFIKESTATAPVTAPASSLQRNLSKVRAAATVAGMLGASGNQKQGIVTFLQSLPQFQSLRAPQLQSLANHCEIGRFAAGTQIIRQGADNDTFFVIRDGEVLCKQASRETGVNEEMAVLTAGDSFGETSLMQSQLSEATYEAKGDVRCLTLTRQVFSNLLSGEHMLGTERYVLEAAQNPEVKSLTRHVAKVHEIMTSVETAQTLHRAASMAVMEQQQQPQGQQQGTSDVLLDLLAAFSPELSMDDVIERMVRVVYDLLQCEHVLLWLVKSPGDRLVLKVAKSQRGYEKPLAGIEGDVVRSALVHNVADASQDPAFDAALGPAHEMLTVPIRNSVGQVSGVLQCRGNGGSGQPFPAHDVQVLGVVADEFAQVLTQKEQQLALSNEARVTPLHTMTEKLRVNLVSLTMMRQHRHVRVTASLYHGGVLLAPMLTSRLRSTRAAPSGGLTAALDQWLEFDIPMCNLPPATRLIFNTYSKNHHPVSWGGCRIFEFNQHLCSGTYTLPLWAGECPTPNVTSLVNKGQDAGSSVLAIELCRYERPVSYVEVEDDASLSVDAAVAPAQPELAGGSLELLLDLMPVADARRMREIMDDPMVTVRPADKALIWPLRGALQRFSAALPIFLLAVDWRDRAEVKEAYRLLYAWEPPTSVEALQLLCHKYADRKVRAYAVSVLNQLSDSQLRLYMLQLVQVLKFEPFHDSALARFLLRRALASPRTLGHTLFWYLKAEMHVPDAAERFGILLNLYMRHCGKHRAELGQQMFVIQALEEVAQEVRHGSTKEHRLELARRKLESMVLPDCFQLPLDPEMLAQSVLVDRCRVMDSKKKPLWLELQPVDPAAKPIVVLFKAGDDLRQDQLTLQVLGIFDNLWKQQGLDLCMSPYTCISTGDEVGMLEVVQNAETLASIVRHARDGQRSSKEKGKNAKKLNAAMDALRADDVVKRWLLLNNVDPHADEHAAGAAAAAAGGRRGGISQAGGQDARGNNAFDQALNRFARSCAGYCVATYVLGIGDRHNDNIMLKRTGELFHIDFGHFLGNFKSKLGVKRERAPFVFTPALAFVLGNPGHPLFDSFTQLAGEAFNVLRHNARLIVTLFSLMLSCGIPELQSENDLQWFRSCLFLDLDDDSAATKFKDLIIKAMNTKSVRMNDAAHLIARA